MLDYMSSVIICISDLQAIIVYGWMISVLFICLRLVCDPSNVYFFLSLLFILLFYFFFFASTLHSIIIFVVTEVGNYLLQYLSNYHTQMGKKCHQCISPVYSLISYNSCLLSCIDVFGGVDFKGIYIYVVMSV